MEVTNTICPVCTLFLRPGITLKQHLTSHPKQKVIDALVKLSLSEESAKAPDSRNGEGAGIAGIPQTQPNQYFNPVPVGGPQPVPGGNHFFIYQQSMSTSSPHHQASPNGGVAALPFGPLLNQQQYLVPAVYNAQMMPYFYQQQQVIMSSNGIPPQIRALPFELPGAASSSQQQINLEDVAVVASKPQDVPAAADSLKERLDDTETSIGQVQVEEQREEVISIVGSHQDKQKTLKQCPEEGEAQQVEDEDRRTIGHRKQEEKSEIAYKDEQQDQEAPPSDPAAFVHGEDPGNYGDSQEYHQDAQDYQETGADYEAPHEIVDHEECVGTSSSSTSTSHANSTCSEWICNPELNKACQTQNAVNLFPRLLIHEDERNIVPEDVPDFFYADRRNDVSVVFTSDNIPTTFEQAEPVYSSANILNGNEGVEFVNMDDLEGMQVIIGDFSVAPMIPQVDSFDSMQPDRPAILMTIGDVVVPPKRDRRELALENKNNELDDNCMENVNIRSDEKMPPRGELSGQESMGSASDITWNQIQHYQEQNNTICFENNPWEDSNSSEVNSLSHRLASVGGENERKAAVPVVFKEELADAAVANETGKKPAPLVGLDVAKRNPKKLVIKPKRPKKENNAFDNVFTNKLKVEEREREDPDDVGLAPAAVEAEDVKPETKPTAAAAAAAAIPNACQECGGVFATKKELKLHQVEIHKMDRIKPNRCNVCQERFEQEHQFVEHLKVHPLECRLCGKLFYRRNGLKLHTARHLGIKPFKCDMCDKAFITKQKLEEHRNVHTGNSPIKCTMCEETFKRHSNLVQHKNRHHFQTKKKLKDYICFCGEIFHSKKKLAWHKEIHDPRPKACTQCSEKFIHAASLTRHMRRAHNAEYLPDDRKNNQVNAICPICKGCYLRTSLEAHIKSHSGRKPFSCTICSKDFTTKWNLKLHRWTHASRAQKPFRCDMCNGAFVRESDYVAHTNSHKSVRPYTCNYCGAQFIRKYNCQRHVKEHENDKRYACDVCGKSFHRSYYLKDHMRVHSGVRPFACHICGKTSTTKSNHNKHVQIHHAREPVTTEN